MRSIQPLGHPRLVLLDDWRRYQLLEDWVYVWVLDDGVRRITVPKGFTTDLASVPRFLHHLISPSDLRHASLPHDLIYGYAGRVPGRYFTIDQVECSEPWTRRDADRLFARIMREAGVPVWRRRAAYRGVRLGGFLRWRRAAARTLVSKP